MRSLDLQVGRPLDLRVQSQVGHSGHAGLDVGDVFFQQRRIEPRLDPEHQLLPLVGGFHRFRGELGDTGDIGNLGRDHVVRHRVDHQAHFLAQSDPTGLHGWQEESHVDVSQVDHVEELATSRQHFPRLCHAVLHAAVARRLEQAVVDIRLEPGDAGLGRLDGRLRLDYLGTPGLDRRLRRNHLRACRGQRRLGALQGRPIVIELLLRQGIALDQRLGTGEALLRRCQLGLALRHHGLGSALLALALGHQRGRGELGVLRLAHLSLGLGQLRLEHLSIHPRDDFAGLDEVALVDLDLGDPPGKLGRHVHLGGLDASVAAGESLAQAGRSRYLPDQHAYAEQRRHDQGTAQPPFAFLFHPFSSHVRPGRGDGAHAGKRGRRGLHWLDCPSRAARGC